jgi:hypothetical protein
VITADRNRAAADVGVSVRLIRPWAAGHHGCTAVSGVLDSNESGVAVAELPMHRVAALLAAIDRTRVPDDLPARLIAATA